VLVVHGFGDHVGRYADLVRVLGGRGYGITAFDQRGHGASEGRRGDAKSFDLFLEDLDRLWSEATRAATGPLFVYGHSFGGLVVMRWLQTRVERPTAVVLTAPWLATAMAVPSWKMMAAALLLRIAPSLPIPSGASVPSYRTRDTDVIAAHEGDEAAHNLVSARFHAGVLAAQAAARSAPLPEGLRVLLVVPGDDPLVDSETTLAWARERGSGAELRIREGGRHEPHNDLGREEALSGVADWLDARGGPNP